MKKKYLAILLMLLLSLSLVACGSDNSEVEEPIKQEEEVVEKEEEQVEESLEVQRTLEGLKNEFMNEGFEIGDNKEIAYSMVNADEGMKFELDGELIEIYKYNLDNLSDEAKTTVEQAKEGSIDMSGFNVPVKYKNGIMLARHDDHSQGEKIIDIFSNY